MLPRINSQKWTELPHYRILVRICLDQNAACLRILNQPSPSAALNSSQCSVELLLESIQATITLVDRFGERTRWRFTTTLIRRRQVLPEKRVVDVASTVEVKQWEQSVLCLDVLFLGGIGELFGKVVKGSYVGLMVVLVMKFHNLAADGGLERAIVIFCC